MPVNKHLAPVNYFHFSAKEGSGRQEVTGAVVEIIERGVAFVLGTMREHLVRLLEVNENWTFDQLARQLIPDSHAKSARVARRIISKSVEVVDPERYQDVRTCSHRHGKGGFKKNPAALRSAVENQGKRMLTEDEKRRLQELAAVTLYPEGDRHAGQVNYTALTAAMNVEQAPGLPPFTPEKLKKHMQTIRAAARKRLLETANVTSMPNVAVI